MVQHQFEVLREGGLNLVHLNVASILGARKFEMLRQQLENSNVDVFCASETWLSQSVPTGLVEIKGYKCARVDRAWKSNLGDQEYKKGGLICYKSDKIEFNEFKYAPLNCSNRDLEMQWITLEIPNMRRILIINIYRPPQGDYKKACKTIREAIGEANLKDNAEIYLLGDFNIDLRDRKGLATKELLSLATHWGLKAQINGVTRPNWGNVNSGRRGSCIDNIFINSEHIAGAETLDWNFSDHMAVAIKRKRERIRHEKVTFEGRSYKNYVKEDMQQLLIQAGWRDFYESRDPAFYWEYLLSQVRQYLNRTCPQKKFKVNVIREPWLKNEMIEEIKDKDRLLRTAKRTGKAEDWQLAKLTRNRVGRLVDQARAEFLKEQQDKLREDPKKFWRVVKTIIPGKKKVNSRISLVNKELDKEGASVDSADTPDFINKFFSNIGPKQAKVYKEPWVFQGIEVQERCEPFETDFNQVFRLFKDIVTIKSSGVYDVSTKVMKDAFLCLIPQLVYLFNLSFTTGKFPGTWKRATIIPLYKGGNKTDVSNYRPVSFPSPWKAN